MSKLEGLKALAQRNGWQCFRDGEFTWFAEGNCPNNGSSDCPLTMKSDSKCDMTDEDEREAIRAWGAWADERTAR